MAGSSLRFLILLAATYVIFTLTYGSLRARKIKMMPQYIEHLPDSQLWAEVTSRLRTHFASSQKGLREQKTNFLANNPPLAPLWAKDPAEAKQLARTVTARAVARLHNARNGIARGYPWDRLAAQLTSSASRVTPHDGEGESEDWHGHVTKEPGLTTMTMTARPPNVLAEDDLVLTVFVRGLTLLAAALLLARECTSTFKTLALGCVDALLAEVAGKVVEAGIHVANKKARAATFIKMEMVARDLPFVWPTSRQSGELGPSYIAIIRASIVQLQLVEDRVRAMGPERLQAYCAKELGDANAAQDLMLLILDQRKAQEDLLQHEHLKYQLQTRRYGDPQEMLNGPLEAFGPDSRMASTFDEWVVLRLLPRPVGDILARMFYLCFIAADGAANRGVEPSGPFTSRAAVYCYAFVALYVLLTTMYIGVAGSRATNETVTAATSALVIGAAVNVALLMPVVSFVQSFMSCSIISKLTRMLAESRVAAAFLEHYEFSATKQVKVEAKSPRKGRQNKVDSERTSEGASLEQRSVWPSDGESEEHEGSQSWGRDGGWDMGRDFAADGTGPDASIDRGLVEDEAGEAWAAAYQEIGEGTFSEGRRSPRQSGSWGGSLGPPLGEERPSLDGAPGTNSSVDLDESDDVSQHDETGGFRGMAETEGVGRARSRRRVVQRGGPASPDPPTRRGGDFDDSDGFMSINSWQHDDDEDEDGGWGAGVFDTGGGPIAGRRRLLRKDDGSNLGSIANRRRSKR